MVYMKILSHSKSRLRLARGPGLRSWATFMGIVAIGLGLLIYTNEGILLKFIWFLCTVFVAISTLDDWEECIVDKNLSQVKLETNRLLERLLRPFQKTRSVVADTSEVASIDVEHEDIRFFGRGYYVAFHMVSGMVLPITEKCTLGNPNDHQLIADILKDFLQEEIRENYELYVGNAADDMDMSSSSSEE